VLPDPLLARYFAHLDETALKHLRWHMIAFLAAATGGPNRYTGREMRAAHAHLGITSQAFDRVATHLLDTLIDLGVAGQDRASVLAAVAPLKPLIIHQPRRRGPARSRPTPDGHRAGGEARALLLCRRPPNPVLPHSECWVGRMQCSSSSSLA
jgi:hemoglobin